MAAARLEGKVKAVRKPPRPFSFSLIKAGPGVVVQVNLLKPELKQSFGERASQAV